MKYVRIPKERIAILIGKKGETKKYIESHTGLILEIDSELGDITINDVKSQDPLAVMKVELIISAIGRGFSPDRALSLLSDSMDFYVFDIHEYTGRKPTQIRRIKSRIIGTNGKTKRVIEELTGAHLSIYGHTIAIINDIDTMDITKRAIDMLLTGSKHHTVYAFLERNIKKLKMGSSL